MADSNPQEKGREVHTLSRVDGLPATHLAQAARSPKCAILFDSTFWVIKIICSPALSTFRVHKKRNVGVASVIPFAS
ncbi:hypothetical protein PC121_g14154 [Phytophthora cactorum]|nr:hypothetical protein PC120_g8631 [Phytophthora cactorum]KAG3058976.1 hypothetical protein PC121_g14154 [Phytophthora cactorum]KAG4052305.1 hypothetical protein PC123_g12517 [Phytophthora cactorum]